MMFLTIASTIAFLQIAHASQPAQDQPPTETFNFLLTKEFIELKAMCQVYNAPLPKLRVPEKDLAAINRLPFKEDWEVWFMELLRKYLPLHNGHLNYLANTEQLLEKHYAGMPAIIIDHLEQFSQQMIIKLAEIKKPEMNEADQLQAESIFKAIAESAAECGYVLDTLKNIKANERRFEFNISSNLGEFRRAIKNRKSLDGDSERKIFDTTDLFSPRRDHQFEQRIAQMAAANDIDLTAWQASAPSKHLNII